MTKTINNQQSTINNRSFGFTLLELLVVISIIGILVAIGAASYTTAQQKSRDARRKGDLKAVQPAFEQYYSSNSDYPGTTDERDTALTNGTPIDPKGTGLYVYTWNFDTTDQNTYCVCALLETAGSGNASSIGTGGDGASCSYGGNKNYFCVSNLQ